jgi:hypothetical protein
MFLLMWLSLSDMTVALPTARRLVCGSSAWNRLIRRPVEAHCARSPSDDVCQALEAVRTCAIGGERVRRDDPIGRTIEATRTANGGWSLLVQTGGAEGDWNVKATIRRGKVVASTSEEYKL